jgi:hypothetical protein
MLRRLLYKDVLLLYRTRYSLMEWGPQSIYLGSVHMRHLSWSSTMPFSSGYSSSSLQLPKYRQVSTHSAALLTASMFPHQHLDGLLCPNALLPGLQLLLLLMMWLPQKPLVSLPTTRLCRLHTGTVPRCCDHLPSSGCCMGTFPEAAAACASSQKWLHKPQPPAQEPWPGRPLLLLKLPPSSAL